MCVYAEDCQLASVNRARSYKACEKAAHDGRLLCLETANCVLSCNSSSRIFALEYPSRTQSQVTSPKASHSQYLYNNETMCLPCFPWTWTQYEDPLESMPPHSVWVHDGTSWSLQQVVSVSILFYIFHIIVFVDFWVPSLHFCALNVKSLVTDNPAGPSVAAGQPKSPSSESQFSFPVHSCFSGTFTSFFSFNHLLRNLFESLPPTQCRLTILLRGHQSHCPRQLAKALDMFTSTRRNRSKPTVYVLTKLLWKR